MSPFPPLPFAADDPLAVLRELPSGPLGLYGGSFDPVHRGHLAVAEAARSAFGLEAVIFMPAARPPHKPGRRLAPARDRLAMLELALAGHPAFVASTLELQRSGPSYTYDTVRELLAARPGQGALHLILGGDNLPGLPSWREAEALLELVQPIVHGRAGDGPDVVEELAGRLSPSAMEALRRGFLPAPHVGGRATYLRAALGRGGSHRNLPAAVADYALRRGLYGPVGQLR